MSGVDALKGTCMSEGWCNCAVPQARARVAASVASANYGTALEDVKNYIVAKENCGKQALQKQAATNKTREPTPGRPPDPRSTTMVHAVWQ